MKVAVLFTPDTDRAPALATVEAGPLIKLARASSARRGARSPEYMLELSRHALGESCSVVHPSEPAFTDRVRAASEIVLLWPDSIGSGWWRVERMVFRRKSRDARVTALNGRRRRFELDWRSLAAFRVRRLLEHMWIGEIAWAAMLMLAVPFLVVWDFVRGRK